MTTEPLEEFDGKFACPDCGGSSMDSVKCKTCRNTGLISIEKAIRLGFKEEPAVKVESVEEACLRAWNDIYPHSTFTLEGWANYTKDGYNADFVKAFDKGIEWRDSLTPAQIETLKQERSAK